MTVATKTESNVQQAVPFFWVRDIDESLRFYIDGLGFTKTIEWVDDGKGPRQQGTRGQKEEKETEEGAVDGALRHQLPPSFGGHAPGGEEPGLRFA